MLTKEEFNKLCNSFNLTKEKFHEQTNHYFDTPDFALKNAGCGLRIREVQNRFECTLKEPAEGIGLTETTDLLQKETVQSILARNSLLHAEEVEIRLQALNVHTENLQILGTLLTKRAEIEYKGGLLVFDHSIYADIDDYELEYEVQDEANGKRIFEQFLAQFSIPSRPADKKVARFMSAINKKRG